MWGQFWSRILAWYEVCALDFYQYCVLRHRETDIFSTISLNNNGYRDCHNFSRLSCQAVLARKLLVPTSNIPANILVDLALLALGNSGVASSWSLAGKETPTGLSLPLTASISSRNSSPLLNFSLKSSRDLRSRAPHSSTVQERKCSPSDSSAIQTLCRP